MAAKIRLKKVGRKGHPSYRVVVLDGRKPRDAKVVADLGYYDPKTNPARFEIDTKAALKWLGDGAKATKAARDILSRAGVMAAWNAIAHGGATPEKAQELAAGLAQAARGKKKATAKTRTAKSEENEKTQAQAAGAPPAENP